MVLLTRKWYLPFTNTNKSPKSFIFRYVMLSFGHWTRNIYCVVDVDASSFKQLLRALERCSPVEQFLNFTIILVMQISDGRSVKYSIIDINNNSILICLLCNDNYTVYNKYCNLKCRIILWVGSCILICLFPSRNFSHLESFDFHNWIS